MSAWAPVKVGEIANKIAMGPFGSNIKVETFVPSGVPVISGQHLHKTRLDETSGYNFITGEHAARLKNSLVVPGDVIFTHAGTIGQVSLIPPDSDFAEYVISQRQFYLRLNRTLADPMFVTYWFHGPVGRHRLLMHASQVGVPSISRPATNLRNIEIELPSLPEQRAIAATLGALDDKIALNRKMNATLEAMARALFRDWFVDFGPTRAKIEGAAPYLSPDLWSLFPDRLDAEGKPEGWETTTLGAVTSELRRGVSPKYTSVGGVMVLNQKCIRNREVNTAPARFHDNAQKKVADRQLRDGDILVNSTGVGTLGRVAQLWKLQNPMIVDSHVTVVRPNPDRVSHSFLGVALTEREADIEALGEGSTGQTELSRARLAELNVLIPPLPVQSAFDSLAVPILNRMEANRAESRTLAQTRDLLLPRLMSGELRVADIAPSERGAAA